MSQLNESDLLNTSLFNYGEEAAGVPKSMLFKYNVLRYITFVFYMGTFIFGCIGNSLVLYIITKFKDVRQKSVANYYIWNLALADELFILAVPLYCYATFYRNWPFGDICCKVAYVIREANKFASVFTLVALSVDRYFATFHRAAFLRTLQVGKVVCITIWVLGMVLTTPYWIYAKTITNAGNRNICRLVWPEKKSLNHMKFWTWFKLTLGLLLPLTFLCLAYVLLMHRLKKIMKLRDHERVKKPNRRMTRTIFVVVIIFLLCQTPYHITQLVNVGKAELTEEYRRRGERYIPNEQELTLFIYFNALANILVFVSSCCNPILYGLLNDNYREYIYAIGRRVRVLCCNTRGRNGNPESRHPSDNPELPVMTLSL